MIFVGALIAGGAADISRIGEPEPTATSERDIVHVIPFGESEPEVTSAVDLVPTEKMEYDQIKQIEAAERSSVTPMEVVMIAKVIYGEARGVVSETEQAAVAWCILNRADAWGQTVTEVIEAPNQVCYYDFFPTVDDYGRNLVVLAQDVVERWNREKSGETDVGRVLPAEYLWYGGDGERNWFRDDYEFNGSIWDWSLPSPYES